MDNKKAFYLSRSIPLPSQKELGQPEKQVCKIILNKHDLTLTFKAGFNDVQAKMIWPG